MTGKSEYHGHMTMTDGSHVALSGEDAERLWAACEAAEERRREEMPDEATALNVMFNAYTRLRDFGWSDAIYCPKDGSLFDVIEAGSSGIHKCFYHGKWPDGSWLIMADGDLYPSHPILWRAIKEEKNP